MIWDTKSQSMTSANSLLVCRPYLSIMGHMLNVEELDEFSEVRFPLVVYDYARREAKGVKNACMESGTLEKRNDPRRML